LLQTSSPAGVAPVSTQSAVQWWDFWSGCKPADSGASDSNSLSDHALSRYNHLELDGLAGGNFYPEKTNVDDAVCMPNPKPLLI